MLPPPLDGIEAWLQEVEHLQAEDLPDLQDPFKAMSLFREIIVTFKVSCSQRSILLQSDLPKHLLWNCCLTF